MAETETTDQADDQPEEQPKGQQRQRRDRRRRSRLSGAQAAERAMEELYELTGKEMSGVVALERADDGWKVTVETVELRRVPATTDLLATYEVQLDGGGELAGYRRLGRYVRGAPDEE